MWQLWLCLLLILCCSRSLRIAASRLQVRIMSEWEVVPSRGSAQRAGEMRAMRQAPESSKLLENELCVNKLTDINMGTQIVVVLVGLPGCGKSTFARQVVSTAPHGVWCIACQDVEGDRKKVERLVKDALEGKADGTIGGRVIVDRCNFNLTQRKHWVDIARQHRLQLDVASGQELLLLCVVLPNASDVEFCSSRATVRGNDGVHPDDQDWAFIGRSMASQWSEPSAAEGFDAMFWCSSQDDLDLVGMLLGSAPSLLS